MYILDFFHEHSFEKVNAEDHPIVSSDQNSSY